MKRIRLRQWQFILLVCYLILTISVFLFGFFNKIPGWIVMFHLSSSTNVTENERLILGGLLAGIFVLGFFFCSQLLFLTGLGTNLCQPFRRHHVLLPVLYRCLHAGTVKLGIIEYDERD